MDNSYLLAVIMAAGPMEGEKYQIVGVLRSEYSVDLLLDLEHFFYDEIERAYKDKEITKQVGEFIYGDIYYSYNIVNETLAYFDFRDQGEGSRYSNLELKNAKLMDRSMIFFLPLKTAYEIEIYRVTQESGLIDCTSILIEARYNDSSEPAGFRYPMIKKLIPADKVIESVNGTEVTVVYKNENNVIIRTGNPEKRSSWPGPSLFLFDIYNSSCNFKNLRVKYHKPANDIGLKDVESILRFKYIELDLSDIIIKEESEKWQTFLGFSHSGPVYGASGEKKIDVFNKLLSEISAHIVYLPDDVARRHVNTINKNNNIKSVKVSENCKLFTMLGDDLYNKKKTKLIMKARL